MNKLFGRLKKYSYICSINNNKTKTMGYTTDFSGQFEVTPQLDDKIIKFINKLQDTRRMQRNLDDKFGVQGEFYVDGGGFAGQEHESNILNYNTPPSTQPGLWCQWEINEEDNTIKWNGGEKFYSYTEWLVYLIEKILKPNGYTVNGRVSWSGEDTEDVGRIVVTDNVVTTIEAFSDKPQTHEPTENMRTDIVYIPQDDISDEEEETASEEIVRKYGLVMKNLVGTGMSIEECNDFIGRVVYEVENKD